MPFINVIEPEDTTFEPKKIYENLTNRRGKLAMVHKIQSLNPEFITYYMHLYMKVMFGKLPLKRAQREMMAVVVSASTDSEYCQLHHAEALNHFRKNEEIVNQLRKDYAKLDLSETDLHLCQLAKKLTKTPSNLNEENDIQPLKDLGLSVRTILDASLIISYINFVNRIVLGLGVETDKEEVQGYNY
jgi:uncharacterized peroxidase-related enzyme